MPITPEQLFTRPANDYSVADMSAETVAYGRKDIEMSQVEMPGLMSTRAEYGAAQPFANSRISGSLHMTIQTAVLIETLASLGAAVRWCSCNIFSTQNHAAAAVAAAKTAKVFAWKGMTLEEYWINTFQALFWTEEEIAARPQMSIVDDGQDMNLLVHEGVKAEKLFKETGTAPNPDAIPDGEFKIITQVLKLTIEWNPNYWTKLASSIIGVSEETTTGVHRLHQMAANGELMYPAINVNDSVTKSKFDNVYGCRHSLPDGIMRATDVMLAGKFVFIAGYGDVGKGSAQAMKAAGARVAVGEADPICALQACMEGYQVTTLEDVISEVDIVITTTGNKDIVLFKHMAAMKNNAIVGNIGHFDNEIEVNQLMERTVRENIKPQVDRFIFPDGHAIILLAEGRLLNLGCATGHPSFVMSCSFTNQTVAQIDLWENKDTGKYGKKVYVLPKILDEKVARLHLDKLGAKLTVLTQAQADYINVPVEGPYKPVTYRY